MRVLFLTDSFRPARSACANRVCVLVDALQSAGVDVQVLTSADSLLDVPADYCPPDYVTFFKTFPLQEKTLVNRLKNNFSGQHESVKAAKTMGDFDVVICTSPPLLLTTSGMQIARQKSAKLVLDIRDIWPDVAYEMGTFTPGSAYGRFFSAIAKRGYASVDLITTVSPGKVKKISGYMASDRQDRVCLIPNGVDETLLDNEFDSEIVERFSLDSGPICSYAGNVGLAQGLDTLLDIAAARPDVRFLIFGEGADKRRLQQRAADESLVNVEFCGMVDARSIYTVLNFSALSYVPLVNSQLKDSIPTKLYEALGCGCPVLLAAADDGDAAHLLDEVPLGRHAAPEDGKALLAAFDEILDEGYSREQRSSVQRYVVENHSRQRFAKEFAELLLERFG